MGGEPRLQGRDAELALLRGALDGAFGGRGRLALVTGEAGIGKSALSTAIAEEASRRGAIVTWGRAWEYADAPPYFPVRPCLRALAIEHDLAKATEADAFQLWEHVLGKIGALPSGTTHVWILEDLHAADLQTLDLLTFLAQPIRGAGILIVATSRAQDPRLTDRMKQRLTRMARDGVDVRLEPLADLDVAALAEQTIGRALPAAALKRLVEVTRGNPLFIVECSRTMDEASGTGGALPPTVRQVVLERVALLDESTRDTLACGAILGRDFAAATVARMRDVLPARVIDSLLPALRAGIVSESRPGHFVFSHTLVCEAIEDALAASERCSMHARAVSALEPLGDGTDVLVERARHALLSQTRGEEAVALGARATKLLEAQGAFDRAFALHERIEDARRAGIAAPSSSVERLHVARIAEAAGRHADCRRIADEVIAAARAAGDVELFGAAVLLVGKALRPGVIVRSLVSLLEEARAMPGKSPSLDARLLARLAAALQPHEDPELPCAMAREAIAKARALGDDAVLLEILETAGSALVDFAPIDERIERAQELHERATKANDKPRTLRASLRLAIDWMGKGDFVAFEREVDRMMALAAELGHPRYRWRVLLTASLRAVTNGAFVESDRYVVEVQQLATLTDDPALPMSLGAHELCRARVMRRDHDARALADGAALLFEGVPETVGFASLLRAAVFARMEDVAAVRTELAVMGRNPMMARARSTSPRSRRRSASTHARPSSSAARSPRRRRVAIARGWRSSPTSSGDRSRRQVRPTKRDGRSRRLVRSPTTCRCRGSRQRFAIGSPRGATSCKRAHQRRSRPPRCECRSRSSAKATCGSSSTARELSA